MGDAAKGIYLDDENTSVLNYMNSRISKRFPLLRFAACCTVLRSRWCRSGVNIALLSA